MWFCCTMVMLGLSYSLDEEVYSLTLAGLCKYILSGVWGFILTKLGWWSLGV